jgi:hypothetical protein
MSVDRNMAKQEEACDVCIQDMGLCSWPCFCLGRLGGPGWSKLQWKANRSLWMRLTVGRG